MTELRKAVKRTTSGEYSVVRVGKPRKVVVCLLPGDVLGFRELKKRKMYLLPIDTAFRYAVRREAEALQAAKPRRVKRGKI